MAAAIRTEHTVMASLTLLRTQLVGCAYAAYIADPTVDGRERVRRAMNAYLDSMTEEMRLVGREDRESVAEYDRLAAKREHLIRGAKALGWRATSPATSKSWWTKDWWIGDKPPDEMNLINNILGDVTSHDRVGKQLYQYLCATVHVQAYGMLSFVKSTVSSERSDGRLSARTGMDGAMLTTLALAAMCALTVAMDRCVALYGWNPDLWRRDVIPFVNDLRQAAGVPAAPRGVQLLG